MTRLGFVTGLRAESRLIEKAARRAGHKTPLIACAGADAGRAESGAASLAAAGAEVIVSFGLCGGLDPSLKPGILILAESIVDRAGHGDPTDTALRARVRGGLQDAGLDPLGGRMFGSDAAAASALEKSRLFKETGALAVDMESHGVARAAAKAGVPFLVLRAVADPAARDLPQAALLATASDGGVRYGAVIAALLRRPWEMGAMLRLARDARAGFAALEAALPVLLGEEI